ncbi:MAG: VWA domain-containing protein, partial [Thermodesulfobacteriota bacterium]|nr:VWA domain-containing protein [Thermodesulfobacteriota bacterium]
MQRKSTNDLAIDRIYAPVNAASGQSFMITAWLHSPVKQEISYEFKRGPYVLASGKKVISSGLSNIIFRDTAEKPGTHSYSLKVTGINKDPVPENNLAKILVGISGPHSTLCVTSSKNSSFVKLLKKGGLEVDVKLPNECKWTLEEIAPYSAILIENIPAGKIGIHGMENISLWVQHTGKGLMMTGGKNSYAPGGYFRSPLEKIMPVSMELRQEHRKILVSIIIALDRSGSMAVSAGGGKTKMDLANIGAVQVMDLLSPMDEIGVIAVDSAPHTIVNINTVEKNRARRLEVLQIGSMGGGIFVYEALSSAANMLLRSNMKTRHIILFADAADSEEPGKYKELLEKCRKANITVSVIGLGTPGDIDANLLKDIALRGGGQCFFTNDPNEIPRLFAQDTFTIARNTFIDETSSIRSTGGLLTITGRPFGKSLEVGGYNLCYARPRANIAVVTEDEYNAPIAASWYAGTGRVLCYTGEADGKFTGPIADWQGIGDFFTGLVRWSTGNSKDLPGNMLTKEKIENGDYIVELHLDPERKDEPFSSAPGLTILRGEPGKKPATEIVNLEWTSADILSAHIPLKGNETVLPILDLNKKHHVVLSPVCLPYSPEFELPNEHKGL